MEGAAVGALCSFLGFPQVTGIMESTKLMVSCLSGFSGSLVAKKVGTTLKFLPKQLTFYFLKCLSLKALESCAIFEQAPFQLDTSLATGL